MKKAEKLEGGSKYQDLKTLWFEVKTLVWSSDSNLHQGHMERGRNTFTAVWHIFFLHLFILLLSFSFFLTASFQVEITSNVFVNGLTEESFACYFLFDTYQEGREDSLPCQSNPEGLKSEGICVISVDLEESEIDEILSRKPLFLLWKNCSLRFLQSWSWTLLNN